MERGLWRRARRSRLAAVAGLSLALGGLSVPLASESASAATTTTGPGYGIAPSNGGVANFDAPWYGSPKAASGAAASATANPIEAITATATGYDVPRVNGGVDNYHTPWHGSLAGTRPSGVHAVSIAPWPGTPSPPPSISTSSLPAGTVGTAYSATLTASGGTTPYTWPLRSGQLPGGLELSSGGAISGTPTTAGTATFGVEVIDASGLSGAGSLSITIAAASSTGLTWSKPISIDRNSFGLRSVSCASTAFCVAVDSGGNVLFGKD